LTPTVLGLRKPEPPGWTQSEVPAPAAEVPEELIEAELEVLRGTVAELVPADRPAEAGDTVIVDLIREDGDGGQRDYVVELGSGRLVPELEQQLVGLAPGEEREVRCELSDEKLALGGGVRSDGKERVLRPRNAALGGRGSAVDP